MMRIRFPEGDRGSLPMVMLVITIGLSLSAAMLPIVVRQVTSTRGLLDRSNALNGAQLGLDVVMARVRAASDNQENGRLEDMPGCSTSGDAGVPGTGEKLLYAVTIVYRDQDGKVISCDPLSDLPTTATVTSTGTSTTGSRTLTATYRFSTSNNNIPGGAIRIASPTDKPLCMDAGSTSPVIGTALTVKLCNGSVTQQFGYTENLYLKLINSISSSAPDGLCLHSGTTHASGNALTFQKCDDTIKTQFQWSLDGNSLFHSTSSKSAIENFCVSMKTPSTVGSAVVLGGCTASATVTVWRSDPGVGAGMAGDATNQLVNYSQFSRCLDVTNKSTSSTYMIAWFCKQSPNGVVDWNQIWEHPIPDKTLKEISKKGPIVVTTGGVKYCLKSPRSAATNVYATTVACPANYATTAASDNDGGIGWTVFHDTGTYATSYRIMDSAGFCLQPTDLTVTPKDTHSDGTSKVKVAVCSGSELQKWNAPANLSSPTPITDVNEK
jgi:type II secretory pathway pseudopilin PulG